MKKRSKVIGTLALLLCLLFGNVLTVSAAYDYEHYDSNEMGFVLSNYTMREGDVQVTMYIYAEPYESNRTMGHTKTDFVTFYMDQPDTEGGTYIYMPLNMYNCEDLGYLENGEIWEETWAAQPGSYTWTETYCKDSAAIESDVEILTKDFERSVMATTYYEDREEADQYSVEESTLVTSSDGRVYLYAIFGHSAWRDEHIDEFIEWAKAYNAEKSEVIAESLVANDGVLTEETTEETVVVQQEDPVVEIEESTEAAEEAEEESESLLSRLAGYIPIILVVIVVLLVIRFIMHRKDD